MRIEMPIYAKMSVFPINDNSLRYLGIASKSVEVIVDNIIKTGLLCDISFGGLEVMTLCYPEKYLNKTVIVTLKFDSGRSLKISGSICRYEPVGDREDIATIVVRFHADNLPMEYKMMISRYLERFGKCPPKTSKKQG